MITYLNDDSFFTNIHFPGQMGWYTLEKWIRSHHIPQFRIILDQEADSDALNLKDKLELYPGIKTFANIVNPWARALYSYNLLHEDNVQNGESFFSQHFDLSSFEAFVLSWSDVKLEDRWYSLSTPQADWIEYIDENGDLKTVDYLLRFEHLDQDFKVLQDYFQVDEGLIHIETCPDYRSQYSTEMKNKIEMMFYKDVERFGYKF